METRASRGRSITIWRIRSRTCRLDKFQSLSVFDGIYSVQPVILRVDCSIFMIPPSPSFPSRPLFWPQIFPSHSEIAISRDRRVGTPTSSARLDNAPQPMTLPAGIFSHMVLSGEAGATSVGEVYLERIYAINARGSISFKKRLIAQPSLLYNLSSDYSCAMLDEEELGACVRGCYCESAS